MTSFDEMADEFTRAAGWKHNYAGAGAAYSTRIMSAIKDLRAAINLAELYLINEKETK